DGTRDVGAAHVHRAGAHAAGVVIVHDREEPGRSRRLRLSAHGVRPLRHGGARQRRRSAGGADMGRRSAGREAGRRHQRAAVVPDATGPGRLPGELHADAAWGRLHGAARGGPLAPPPPKNLRRTDPDYRDRALTYLQDMRRQTRLRGDATLRVMASRPTDGVCVVFYAPDRVQHYFWEYVDPERPAAGSLDDDVRAALLAVYDELDQAVGRLVRAAGLNAHVVLLS